MKKFNNFKQTLVFIILMLPAVLGLASCNNKQDPKNVAEEHNEAKFNENTGKEKDAQFLVNAAEINLEEIQLAQLAQKNGKTTDVRDLAKMMESEHAKSLSELKNLAAQKVITIPTSITEDGQSAYHKLSSTTGTDFDKEYCELMVSGHKEGISKFEKASKECTDEDIKIWATGMIPSLQKHLDHALTCQERCKKM